MESHDPGAEVDEDVVEPDHGVSDRPDAAKDSANDAGSDGGKDAAGDLGGDLGGFAAAFEHERLRLGRTTDRALAALLDAGPEAVEHLLKAAQELLLAAKAVVDAGERAVESHRAATDAAARSRDEPERDPRVRRIDLA